VLLVVGVGIFLTASGMLLNWRTNLPLSPHYTLRITDDSGLRIPGVSVVHEWGLSVMQHAAASSIEQPPGRSCGLVFPEEC
jgi:hypothetical protein